MTFEGYASELGFPVCSGGRYDNLLQQFGRPVPSTGFSLKTNRILDGVSGVPEEEELPILVQYDAPRRKEGLAEAARLRAEGYVVVTRLASEPGDLKTVKRLDTDTVEAEGDKYGEIYTFVSFVSEHG
ncbi:ATP phosphoribosyltransferase regulatory subunit [compost metagenome]